MRRCFPLILAVMLLCSYAAANNANPLTLQSAPEPEEYAVYSALLKEEFIGEETRQLVIQSQTSIDKYSDKDTSEMLGQLSSLTKETIEDFRSRNRQSYELSDKFNLQVEINFLSTDEIKALFEPQDGKHDGWEIFHRKYPTANAIITLSRVGFNAERTRALMFVAHGCGWLCGEGNYILLAKKDGAWKIEKKLMIWIS